VKIVEDVVERALARMTAEERHDLILAVVERMLAQMASEERKALMEHVVDSFLDGLPAEERQSTVRDLVPRLLAQLMQSGGMSVDELLWAAMGSLPALEQGSGTVDQGSEGSK
jgi:hypothetical protein